ncbi:beta-galactosidase [Rufibacter roseus]|uniref:Beta-galactosidase n=1 Tax=Rufibacter roseus TaxID=1567108 RepID=A0ABW2DRM0_9BACT|nr:beta-galactosidase [Rufibacter roseus]
MFLEVPRIQLIKAKTSFIVLVILCAAHLAAIGQKAPDYYKVNINKDQYKTYTGHMKMGTPWSPSGDTLSYTNVYLTKNGKPWFPVQGEMNFTKVPRAQWEDGILKMKAAGIQVIGTYVVWLYHEETEGKFDWSGNKDLSAFLELCKKHDMYVWLRIGPWTHFEVRNGSFPDWLQNLPNRLRSNDPVYLKYADRWFEQIAKQASPHYFKNGGAVIAVQIENELEYRRSEENYKHMLKLKELVLKQGIDVPYYSSFAPDKEGQTDFLHTIGGYGDSPWAQHTDKLFKDPYYIRRLASDPDIGSDLFGMRDTKVYSQYPGLSAEIGSGMQVTYHRRNIFNTPDALGPGFTRLASGLNGLGYFMFHGGINPVGEITPFHETRATGYPNDVTILNYDFTAPIGAMGELKDSYYEFRLTNLFLKDYGSKLATQSAFFPEKDVKTPFSHDTVRFSVRSHNNSGFIFASNYNRNVKLKDAQNFQVAIEYKGKTLLVPEKPVTFPSGKMSIWPFNLDIHSAKLVYSTSQPLFRLKNPGKETHVFFSDGASELVFEAAGIKSINLGEGLAMQNRDGKRYIQVNKPGKKSIISIVPASGVPFDVLVLSKEEALMSSKYSTDGSEHLLVSNALVMVDGGNLRIQKYDNPSTEIYAYPTLSLNLPAQWKSEQNSGGTSFTKYSLNAEPVKLSDVTVKELSFKPEDFWFTDSVLLKKLQAKYEFPLQGAAQLYPPKNPINVYYRKHLNIANPKNKTVVLAFNADDEAEVWVNGKQLKYYNDSRNVSLLKLDKYLTKGDNVLSFKVTNHNRGAGFSAKIYTIEGDNIQTVETDGSWLSNLAPEKNWNSKKLDDSKWEKAVVRNVNFRKIAWKETQPGPQYGLNFIPHPNQKLFSVSLPKGNAPGLKDVLFNVDYSGDVAAVYQKDKLVFDDFNNDAGKWLLRRSMFNGSDKTALFQLFSVQPHYKFYLEDDVKSKFWEGKNPKIENIKLIPVYEYQIPVQSKS